MDFQILGFIGILTGAITVLMALGAATVFAIRNRDKTDGQVVGVILLMLLWSVIKNIKI